MGTGVGAAGATVCLVVSESTTWNENTASKCTQDFNVITSAAGVVLETTRLTNPSAAMHAARTLDLQLPGPSPDGLIDHEGVGWFLAQRARFSIVSDPLDTPQAEVVK